MPGRSGMSSFTARWKPSSDPPPLAWRRAPADRARERAWRLVRLVDERATERRPGGDLVLARLVDVLLIEALRATPGEDALPGCCRVWPMRARLNPLCGFL